MQKEPLGFAGSLNFYAYCEGDAVNFVDLTGLMSDKCSNLLRLINYEANNGKLSTLFTYHSFNEDLLNELNYTYDSIYGAVNVDWILRSSLFGLGKTEILSTFIYSHYSHGMIFWQGIVKPLGNVIEGNNRSYNIKRLFLEQNRNAPIVASRWISGNKLLAEIFEPAAKKCLDYCSLRPNAPVCSKRDKIRLAILLIWNKLTIFFNNIKR